MFVVDYHMTGFEAAIAKDFPAVGVFDYEARHGFDSYRRKDWHGPSAELAKTRTLTTFRANDG